MHELQASGFPMDRVSVITQDRNRDHEIAGVEVRDSVRDTQRVGNKADEGTAVGAATGGALGGLTGLLVGLGTLAIPGVGPILLAGATATTIATTLAGGAIGAVTGGLLGALVGLGIPEERAKVYHDRISRGDYLIIVDGTDEQIAFAERILQHRGIEEYGIYDAPTTHTATTHTATTPVAVNAAPTYSSTGTHPRHRQQAIGVFPHRQDAEHAIADLHSAGFPLSQISLAGRHFDRRDAFTGIGLHDRFEAAQYDIPVEQTRYYSDRFDRGDYIIVVQGTEDEVRHAANILNRHNIQNWHLIDPALAHNTPVHNSSVSSVTPGFTSTQQHRQAIGRFANRQDAEYAIAELRQAGFPLTQVSLVARHFDQREPFIGVDLHDRFDAIRTGMPADRARYYNDQFDRGDYLVVVRGTDNEIQRAGTILSARGIHNWEVYDASGIVNQPNTFVDRSNASVTPGDRRDVRVEQVSTSPDVVIVDRRHDSL
ncbi:MAG: hypothetical protein Kow00121_23190 [Elainellaceae cyanobacterium]